MSIQREESALVPVIRVPIEMPFFDTHDTHSWQRGLGAQAKFVPDHMYHQPGSSNGRQTTKMRRLIADIASKCHNDFYFQEREFESKLFSLHEIYGEYRDAMSRSRPPAGFVHQAQQSQQNIPYVYHQPQNWRGVPHVAFTSSRQ
jgi:hypothetical protein